LHTPTLHGGGNGRPSFYWGNLLDQGIVDVVPEGRHGEGATGDEPSRRGAWPCAELTWDDGEGGGGVVVAKQVTTIHLRYLVQAAIAISVLLGRMLRTHSR
jgi:hypothetical protein